MSTWEAFLRRANSDRGGTHLPTRCRSKIAMWVSLAIAVLLHTSMLGAQVTAVYSDERATLAGIERTYEERMLRSMPFREADLMAPVSPRLMELAKQRVHPDSGILMFTSVTKDYMDMFDNWRCSLSAHNFDHYVIFAGDAESYVQLYRRGEPIFADPEVEELAHQRLVSAGRGSPPATDSQDVGVELAKRVLGPAVDRILGRKDTQMNTRADRISEGPVPKLAKVLGEIPGSAPKRADRYQSQNAFFATVHFELLMLQRLRHMNRLLKEGYHVYLNDCDTVWLRDPRVFYPLLSEGERPLDNSKSMAPSNFAKRMHLSDVDILAQDEMSHHSTMRGHVCTGNVIIFSRPRGMRVWFLAVNQLRTLLLNAIKTAYKSSRGGDLASAPINQNEQDFLHEISRQPGWRNILKIYFWDPKLFPSGKYYFDQRVPQTYKILPANIHNTWILGHDNKVRRFFEHGLWFIVDPKHPSRPRFSCCEPDRVPAQCGLYPPDDDTEGSHAPTRRMKGPYRNSQQIILGMEFPWDSVRTIHDMVYQRGETREEQEYRRHIAASNVQ